MDSYGSSMRMGVPLLGVPGISQNQDRNTCILQITKELPGLFSHDVTLWLQWRAQGTVTERQTRVHVSISRGYTKQHLKHVCFTNYIYCNMPIMRYTVCLLYPLAWLMRIKHQDLQRHYSEINKPIEPIELLGMTSYVLWAPLGLVLV